MRLSNRVWLTLAAMFSALLVIGCGGGGGGGGTSVAPQPINTPPALAVVTPNPNPATLDVRENASMNICFKAEDADGGKLTYTCTWNGGSVTPANGSVNAGSQCDVAFTAPNYNGLCTITVAVNDGQASAVKTVQINVIGAGSNPGNELRVLGIDLNPDEVLPGSTATLSADVQNPPGSL